MSGADELAGRVALVTGGASGIGHATAVTLLARGASVAIFDRDPGGAPEGALALAVDVGDDAAVAAGIEAVRERCGALDVLVNNAGVSAYGTVEDNDDAEWARVLDTNVVGMVRTSRAALPLLRESESGAIVNVCSIAALAGLPGLALYSASKGAVLALTYAMAADLIGSGIRVNCVAPGTVDSPWLRPRLEASEDLAATLRELRGRQPNGRLIATEEVAAAIAYLASPGALSTTGTVLPIDGGFTTVRGASPAR